VSLKLLPHSRPLRLRHRNRVGIVGKLGVASLFLLSGCSFKQTVRFPQRDTDRSILAGVGFHSLGFDSNPKTKIRLLPGDLIIGSKLSPVGFLMGLATEKPGYFGHIGIITEEGGQPIIYEAFGAMHIFKRSESLFGKIEGTIQKIPLAGFMSRYDDVMILRLPNPKKNQKIAELAKASIKEGLEFDPFFDPDSPPPCCTEYPRNLMKEAGYETLPENVGRTTNASVSKVLNLLGIKSRHFLTTQGFLDIPGVTIVDVISKVPSQGLRQVVLESQRLAYENLNLGDSIGNYLDFDGKQGLHFRDRLASYFLSTYLYFLENPIEDPEQRRNIMEKIFTAHFQEKDRQEAG
jgi:hypothetical protein